MMHDFLGGMSELERVQPEGALKRTIRTTTGWLSFGVGMCATAGFAKYGIETASEEPIMALQEHVQDLKLTTSLLGASAGFIVASAGILLATSGPEN